MHISRRLGGFLEKVGWPDMRRVLLSVSFLHLCLLFSCCLMCECLDARNLVGRVVGRWLFHFLYYYFFFTLSVISPYTRLSTLPVLPPHVDYPSPSAFAPLYSRNITNESTCSIKLFLFEPSSRRRVGDYLT